MWLTLALARHVQDPFVNEVVVPSFAGPGRQSSTPRPDRRNARRKANVTVDEKDQSVPSAEVARQVAGSLVLPEATSEQPGVTHARTLTRLSEKPRRVDS